MERKINSKNRKKTMLKLTVLVLVILLVICILGLGKLKYNNTEEGGKEEPVTNKLLQNQLLIDFQNGEITTDEYVKYNIYAKYDKSMLDQKYSKIPDMGNIETLIKKYHNELSDETLQYYVEKVNLNNVTFELGKENTSSESEEKIGLSDFFVSKVYAKSNKVTNLNKAVLSKNGKFVVWYTTTGDSASDYNTAKKVADGLEVTVTQYDELFESKYSYSLNFLHKGKTYENQLKVLESSGIDKSYLEGAMQVYLIEHDSSALATYYGGNGILIDLFNKFVGGDKNGSIALPYIIIKPSSFSDFERLEQLYNHEMFHHYQYYVLAEKLNKEFGEDEYIFDATANWASALITNKTTTKGYLNEWAGEARRFSSDLMSKELAKTYGKDYLAYALFVYLYNYSTEVEDGTEKIIQSMYENDSLKYLQENSTTAERRGVLLDMALKNLSQDYSNKNLIVYKEYNSGVTIKQTIKDNAEMNNIKVNRLGIDYYTLNKENSDFNIYINEEKNSIKEVYAMIISEKDGVFNKIAWLDLNKNERLLGTTNPINYDNVYLIVVNSSNIEESYYSFRIEKKEMRENEEANYTKESNEEEYNENKSKGKYYILGADEHWESYRAYLDCPEGFSATRITEQCDEFRSLFEPGTEIKYSLTKRHDFEKEANADYEALKEFNNVKNFKWYEPKSITIGDKSIKYDKITYKHEFESYYLDYYYIHAILKIEDWEIYCRIFWREYKNADGNNLSSTNKTMKLTDEELLKRAFNTTFVIEKEQ